MLETPIFSMLGVGVGGSCSIGGLSIRRRTLRQWPRRLAGWPSASGRRKRNQTLIIPETNPSSDEVIQGCSSIGVRG